jgi:hypothetical protein
MSRPGLPRSSSWWTGSRAAPVRFDIPASSPLTAAQLEQIEAAVDTAIERRRSGQDAGHREHLLQAAIGTDPSLLGVTHLRRELPAWRPRQRPRSGRAFIDFIARDVDRVGHGIETKIGPDAQLGVQALDYWAWAEAHRAELAESIDADTNRPFELDIGLGLSTNEFSTRQQPPPCRACTQASAGAVTS